MLKVLSFARRSLCTPSQVWAQASSRIRSAASTVSSSQPWSARRVIASLAKACRPSPALIACPEPHRPSILVRSPEIWLPVTPIVWWTNKCWWANSTAAAAGRARRWSPESASQTMRHRIPLSGAGRVDSSPVRGSAGLERQHLLQQLYRACNGPFHLSLEVCFEWMCRSSGHDDVLLEAMKHSISSHGTAPARTRVGRRPERSTMVEETPTAHAPSSSTISQDTPNCSRT